MAKADTRRFLLGPVTHRLQQRSSLLPSSFRLSATILAVQNHLLPNQHERRIGTELLVALLYQTTAAGKPSVR